MTKFSDPTNSSSLPSKTTRTISSTGTRMQSCLNSTLICLSYGNLLSKLSHNNCSNPSTASVTVAAATGDNNKSAVPVLPASSCLKNADSRLCGLFQQQQFQQSTTSSLISSSSSVHPSSSSSPCSAITNSSASSTCHKMTGGIRRTVSSATPGSIATGMGSMSNHTSTSTSVRSVQQALGVTKSLNTQQSTSSGAVRGAPATQISSQGSKDPHKKLDRSFSEPAEKKNSSASAAAAAAAAASASSLGPSSRYKTELCRSFAEVGSCKYGDKCQFAHGEEELRTVSRHPKFKTENCKSFHSTGFCPYGPRCHFIHNDESKKAMLSNGNGSSSQSNINNVGVVPSSPSAIVGSQRSSMFEPVIGSNQQHQNVSVPPFPSASPPTSMISNNGANLVRPKALSLGSYSLGSSGEISSPSSQSGSPTSLNSFFTEDSGFLGSSGTPFCLSSGVTSSRLQNNSNSSNNAPFSSAFGPQPPSSAHQNPHSPFSFSPDSAFVSFHGAHSNASNSSTTSGSSLSFGGGSQKCIFGGSQPTLSSNRFSPVDHHNHQQHHQQLQQQNSAGETANSVFFSLFGATEQSLNNQHHQVIGNNQHNQQQQHFSDLYRTMSPIGKPTMTTNNILNYPMAPESPVDSVASEIEALKLGEIPSMHHGGHHHQMMSGFAPISPSFSSSSLSNASSASPPNGTSLLHAELEAQLSASGFGTVHIPRLPTFTRFAATSAHE